MSPIVNGVCQSTGKAAYAVQIAEGSCECSECGETFSL